MDVRVWNLKEVHKPQEVKRRYKEKRSFTMVGNRQINRQLRGMLEICQYVGFTESTVLGWIRTAGFPVRKTRGSSGIWVTTTRKIDKWIDDFLGRKD